MINIEWPLNLRIIYSLILLVVCLRIIYDTRNTTKTLAYLLFALFVPFAGIAFYFIFGINYRKRKIYTRKLAQNDDLVSRLMKDIYGHTRQTFNEHDAGIQNNKELAYMLINDSMTPITSHNEVKLLKNGENKFSAVHGMLAAIGIIIIAKQIPVLMGDDPAVYKGETPIQLLMDIPKFIMAAHPHLAIIGILSLVIMFTLPQLNVNFLKKVPAPMVVLIITIPLGLYWHFQHDYSLVKIGNFWQNVKPNVDFAAAGTFTFWKYVFMFLFVNSLESLLTVKAIDGKDPYKRESSYNGDLIGLGAGNALSGFLGGLPMISEVVRSNSNVGFGAKTKWSNFFHGIFLFLAMLLLIPVIENIPNAALAAMLIFAGFRLASPKEFIGTYKIGKEQLAIFVTTILVTLLEDLLMGVAAGILVKFLFHLSNGASFKSLFKAQYEVLNEGQSHTIKVSGSAVFSNLIGYKKVLSNLPQGERVIVDFSNARLVDHSFMEFVHHFEHKYNDKGGNFKITGLENHKALSEHPLATRKKK